MWNQNVDKQKFVLCFYVEIFFPICKEVQMISYTEAMLVLLLVEIWKSG